MKTRRTLPLVGAIIVLACVVGAGAVLQSTPTTTVYESEKRMYTNDPDVTTSDLEALADSVALGQPPPPGFTLVGKGGKVTCVLTGMVIKATGEVQFLVTVTDDAVDMNIAKLHVQGQLAATATDANGGIVVRDSLAIASMTGYVQPITPITIKVEWEGVAGGTNSDELTIQY